MYHCRALHSTVADKRMQHSSVALDTSNVVVAAAIVATACFCSQNNTFDFMVLVIINISVRDLMYLFVLLDAIYVSGMFELIVVGILQYRSNISLYIYFPFVLFTLVVCRLAFAGDRIVVEVGDIFILLLKAAVIYCLMDIYF